MRKFSRRIVLLLLSDFFFPLSAASVVAEHQEVAHAVIAARDLGNERADVVTPAYVSKISCILLLLSAGSHLIDNVSLFVHGYSLFEDVVRKFAEEHGNVSYSSIVGCEALEKEGLNMLSAVGQVRHQS